MGGLALFPHSTTRPICNPATDRVALTVCLAVRAVELLHITSVYHLPPFSPGEESEKSFWNIKWTVEARSARSFSPDSSSTKWEKKVFGGVGIV